MGETEMDTALPQPEEHEVILRCSACGALTDRLHTARQGVRCLSLGTNVEKGDLICERCLQELQEEQSEEERLRGPA
jgi:hypothetical protein